MQHRQRGIAMVEILGALLIAAMLFKGISSMVDSSMEDTKAQQTAQYQSQMVTAASKYLAANYAALTVPTNVGALQTVNFTALDNAAVLPPGMSATNPYGQASCLLILARNKVVAGPAPTTVVVLDALVVTEGSAAQAIPQRVLAYAAANAGPGGGFFSSGPPMFLQGTSRSWRIDATTTPTLDSFRTASCTADGPMAAGSLASALFTDGPGQAADFLYRNKVGSMPALNTMNTPLLLKTGSTNSAEVVAGDVCDGAGIAVNNNKSLMYCNKSNRWQRVTTWKEPVSDHGALWSTATDDREAGDVRMVSSLGRAFTYNGTTWTPLAADEHNNMTVHDLIAEQDVIARRDATVARRIGAGENIGAGGNITASGAVQGGHVIATLDVTAGQDMKAVRDVTAGQDLKAGRDVEAERGRLLANIGGAYVHHLLVEQWASAATMAIWDRKSAGEKCHIPKIVDGRTEYDYPIGTMVLDRPNAGAPVAMICSGNGEADAVFVYPNGTGAR